MLPSRLLAALCGIALASAAILPKSSPSVHATLNVPRNQEEDAMHALEVSAFTDEVSTGSTESHSSKSGSVSTWDLHVCLLQCDAKNSYDTVKLAGHHNMLGPDKCELPEDQWTFRMCTESFRTCNQNCLENHQARMATWPPANSNAYHIFTSPQLSSCASTCNKQASHDNTLVKTFAGMPPNFYRDATFADCNQRLSTCVAECEVVFGEALQEWENDRLPYVPLPN